MKTKKGIGPYVNSINVPMSHGNLYANSVYNIDRQAETRSFFTARRIYNAYT